MHIAVIDQDRDITTWLEKNIPKWDFHLISGVGEGTFLITEQFALSQVLREGSVIHGRHGKMGPSGMGVDITRQEFLAGTAFPLDQDRGIAGGNPSAGLEQVQQDGSNG